MDKECLLNYDNYFASEAHFNVNEANGARDGKEEEKIMKMYANMCELLHCCEAEHDIKTAKRDIHYVCVCVYKCRDERQRLHKK
jgi:hypothetical protein